MVEHLKDLVAASKGKLSAADRRKLVGSVSRKVVQMIKKKTNYSQVPIEQFLGNYFAANTNNVCTGYSAIMTYIMGATKLGTVPGWSGHNAWFYYSAKKYPGLGFYDYTEAYEKNVKLSGRYVATDIGCTTLANNTTVLTKDTNINKNKIAAWMDNPTKYKTQLESLIGTVFMERVGINNKPYDTYVHTGIIDGYRIDAAGKAELILNDSTSYGNREEGGIIDSTNCIGTTIYKLGRIRGQNAFDIYDINY